MPLHIKPNHMYTNLFFFEEEHQNISNMLTKLTLIELKIVLILITNQNYVIKKFT